MRDGRGTWAVSPVDDVDLLVPFASEWKAWRGIHFTSYLRFLHASSHAPSTELARPDLT